jgi:hypothetical protein
VVLLPGMGGIATRLFLSTMTLMASGTGKFSVFDAVEPAQDWLAGLLTQRGVPVPGLKEWLQAARDLARKHEGLACARWQRTRRQEPFHGVKGTCTTGVSGGDCVCAS